MEECNIQWFPGHMKKTERLIKENISNVDLIIELIDARIPISSRNPMINNLIKNKPRLLILNKSDLADPKASIAWIKSFKRKGLTVLLIDSKNKKRINSVIPTIRSILADLLALRSKRGMVGRIVRVMVVGVPNVGKSTFINGLAGSYKAKAEDRPGVTKAKQWVHIDGDIDLLDMPGTLWPKFEDSLVGLHLAFIGSIKDDIYDIEYVAENLLDYLSKNYLVSLEQRYKVRFIDYKDSYEKLKALGRARGMFLKGGEIDTERAAMILLDEYRSGKLGRITLELPDD